MNARDVVITGLGVISPLGNSVKAYYENIASGRSAIKPVPWPTPEGFGGWFAAVEDFQPTDWMSEKIAQGSDRFTQFVLAATAQALEDAGLDELDRLRTGVVMGTGMGGTRSLQRAQSLLEREGPHAVPPKTMIQIWPNMAAAQVAMQHGLHGPSLTICTACAASIDAIGYGTALIRSGAADVVIAGGAEGTADVDFLQATVVAQGSYGMATASSEARRSIMPFDENRTGIVGGEGSGVVILEAREIAERRGARVWGTVRGYASLADAHHPSTPEPQGTWEALAMNQALANADLPDGIEVDAVYAHGTGTPVGDSAEIRAINSVFAGRVDEVKVTSLKGAIGHTGGAAGVMNLVAGLTGLQNGEVLPTANTVDVDSEAKFPVVLGGPWVGEVRAIQLNGFGFGGQNASIVVTG